MYKLVIFSIFCISGILSFFITYLTIIVAKRLDFYAHPDHRSSHIIPTPRIGGWGFAIPFFLYLILNRVFFVWRPFGFAEQFFLLDKYFFQVLLMGGVIAFVMGFIDDTLGLKPTHKFLAQIVVAIIPPSLGVGLYALKIPFLPTLTIGSLPGSILAVLWILFFMNIFNFMDGMDGKAGSFAISSVVFITLALIIKKEHFDYYPLLLILAGGIGGFLYFNLPPAKTFMGDCGSQLLGFILAVFAMNLNGRSPERYSFIGFIILFLPFIYDATYTLIRRALRGENLTQAHHSHLYQRLLELKYTHSQVLRIVKITYLSCGICALLYILVDLAAIKVLSFLLGLLSMITYTLFVINKEKRN